MVLNRKLAVYVREGKFRSDPAFGVLMDELRNAGFDTYMVGSRKDLVGGTSMLLSVGGDGTLLSAASLVADNGLPVLGVNFGRLGFLSENKPEEICPALVNGAYKIESRSLLKAEVTPEVSCSQKECWPFALNEFTVHRSGAATLGVNVCIDGHRLPVYWSDGLLVATSSGSTAYSLSVGGPIVLPDSRVLIISPIAPHNLNVRPLIVPDTSKIEISFVSRDKNVLFTADNRNAEISSESTISISLARFSLKRVRLDSSNFINALTEKLFWGEDIRNMSY